MSPRSLLLGSVAAAVLAGCGGDDDAPPSTAPPGQTGGPATTSTAPADASTVQLDEFAFAPSELTVEQGAVLRAENVGAAGHNLTIEEGSSPGAPGEELAATPTFAGGEQRELRVDVPPGRYTLVCTVPGHREAGMVGAITVR